MTEYPLFTVIIPQKNRAEYLVHTLRTCMIQDYPNFQVIVSDDCSEDNSVEVVQELAKRDNRIKLFAHSHHLGMRDNFEFALNQVKEGYVMALGGDDGLLPNCIWKMYEIFKTTGLKLLTWPNAGFGYPSSEGGKNILWVRREKPEIKKLKSSDYLKKISNTFNYLVDDCPMFYVKGIASVDLIDKVKSRTSDHCFYYCPTPDGFSGVVLAGEVEEYAYSTEPLSINGSTNKSQGRNYMRSDEKSKAEAEQFFNDNIRRTMHRELASQQYSPLITLMTADYLLTAKDLPGWPGNCYDVSIEKLLIKSFDFIANTPYEKENLVRELKILREIAIQHNLLALFEKLYKETKIKRSRYGMPLGFAITRSLHFEGSEIGINNIFDASIATPFIYGFVCRFSFSRLWELFRNTIIIILGIRFHTKDNLPDIE